MRKCRPFGYLLVRKMTPSGRALLVHFVRPGPLPSRGLWTVRVTSHPTSEESQGVDSARMATILAELNLDPSTDLASLVERVYRNDLAWIVVPALAVAAWEHRDPSGWMKVLAWLETKNQGGRRRGARREIDRSH